MRLFEEEMSIPRSDASQLIEHLAERVNHHLTDQDTPVRFVVTETSQTEYRCEVGVLTGLEDLGVSQPASIFDYRQRGGENTHQFNAVLLVPTGIGAEIGGHAGDAAPVARLLASACDNLITHPNVVNASDINETPPNGLYVEGSVICRLLMGTAGLRKVRANRVILVIDEHPDPEITELVVNSASAARSAMGADICRVVRMDPPIRMQAELSSSGRAVGRIDRMDRLYRTLCQYEGEFDAVALATLIQVPEGTHEEYFNSDGEMVNPWGGVEAMLTHAVSMLFGAPSAHAPMMESVEMLGATFGVVDPRMSAEAVSRCFLHCVLKGLHNSPRIVTDPVEMRTADVLSAEDVSCLVIPDGCLGLPVLAAAAQGIPVIAVRENRNRMRNDLGALPFAAGRLLIADCRPVAAPLDYGSRTVHSRVDVMSRSVPCSMGASHTVWSPATSDLMGGTSVSSCPGARGKIATVTIAGNPTLPV